MQDYTEYAKQPQQFEVLPAGGYIAKIIDVDDRTWVGHSEPAHMIFMDIAEGEHKDIYRRNNVDADKDRWLGHWFAEPDNNSPDWLFSKVGSIQTSLMESNDKVNIFDTRSWKGKLIGVVVGDEEAESNSGTVYTRPYISYVCSIERIKKGLNQPGGYKIPKLKKLETLKPLAPSEMPDSFSAAEDDIPF